MPSKNKSRKRKRKRRIRLGFLIAPFSAAQDAVLHLRDGVVQIFVFFGLVRPPAEKDWKGKAKKSKTTSPREERRAVAKLEKAERQRNRKEVRIESREKRLLNSRTKEGEEFHKEVSRNVKSVSKGGTVSHLSKMQSKARAAEKNVESTTSTNQPESNEQS